MNIIDIIFLAIALAMDCFTVSIVSGVITGKWTAAPMLRMSFLFGLFQALMPLVGWLGISFFSASLESVDHWLAFGLLAFIGGKMVKESFEENDEAHPHFNPSRLRTQLMLSIATSIDALAVGISFGCLGYTSLSSIALPLFVIGLTSFLLAIAGHLLGIRFGKTITRRLKPELFGGIVLLAIGIKILATHLMEA